MFKATDFPRATCNDNTMSGYYTHLSTTGSKDWVVFLEGGE